MSDQQIKISVDGSKAARDIEKVAAAAGDLRGELQGVAKAAQDAGRALGNANLDRIQRGFRGAGINVDAARAALANSDFIASGAGGRRFANLAEFFDSPAARMQTSSRAGMARRAEVFRGLGLDAAAREHGAGYRVTHRGFFGGFAEGATRQSGTLRGTSQMFRGLFGEGEGGAAAGGGFAGGFAGSVAGSVAVMAAQKAWGMMKGYVGAVADEAKAIDSLQRRTGDLGGSFTGLMQQVHKASDGLGVTYAEASKLGNALAKVSGGFQGGDLRSAIGFARATGMDLGRSVDFFGTMRRVGDIGSGESEMKRFAYLIGQAVTASGYSGQVEEITKAVAAYATTSARFGLSSPNFGGYLGALTGLTRTGIPGLDPEGAAAMLSRADATIRAGGAGRWSQAFLMQALGGRIGDPYAARAIWQQGIFGSSAGAFSGPWADMVRQFGGRVPAGTMTTNFAAIRSAFDRVFAGTGTAAPAAFTQLFGLQSDAQGAALHNMRPAAFDNLMHSLQRNGVKMSDVSATGMINFGKVSQAHGIAGLLAVRNDLLNRGDLGTADRAYLTGLNGGMGETALRQALGKFALTREEEDTPATILRRWGADVENSLVGLGDRLLNPLNGILTAVNKIAGIDNLLGSGFMSSGNAPALGLPAGILAGPGGFAAFADALGQAESGNNALARNAKSSAAGRFQFTAGTWAKYGAGLNIWNPTDQAIALSREMADAQARGASTINDLVNFHHYGPGGWRGRGADSEAQRVEHYLTINLTQNGRTISTTRMPLSAGAPIVPAGGGSPFASVPIP